MKKCDIYQSTQNKIQVFKPFKYLKYIIQIEIAKIENCW